MKRTTWCLSPAPPSWSEDPVVAVEFRLGDQIPQHILLQKVTSIRHCHRSSRKMEPDGPHEWSRGTIDKQGQGNHSDREGLFPEPRETCGWETYCPSTGTAQNLPGQLPQTSVFPNTSTAAEIPIPGLCRRS